jgi:hypothetical protein
LPGAPKTKRMDLQHVNSRAQPLSERERAERKRKSDQINIVIALFRQFDTCTDSTRERERAREREREKEMP